MMWSEWGNDREFWARLLIDQVPEVTTAEQEAMLDRTFASEPGAGDHLVPDAAFFDAVDAHDIDDPEPGDHAITDVAADHDGADEHLVGQVGAPLDEEHDTSHDVDLNDHHDPFDPGDDHHEGGIW